MTRAPRSLRSSAEIHGSPPSLVYHHASETDAVLHHGSLVWRAGAAIVPPEGLAAPRILLQLVPEAKTGKNRMHIDVRTGEDDVDQTRARLVERSAHVLHTGRQGPHTWVTMADPEGNEFCL